MNLDPAAATQLALELTDLDWITDPPRVARLSQDFSWFSPVLKRQLADKRADIAVRPRTEDEIRRVVGACARDQPSRSPCAAAAPATTASRSRCTAA